MTPYQAVAVVVNNSGVLLKMRSAPYTTATIVGTLANGQVVNIIGKTDNGWYQLDNLAYSYASYFKISYVITTDIVQDERVIPFQYVTVKDNTKTTDYNVITQAGVNGSEVITYKITYHDGVEVDREIISDTITQPIDQINVMGTTVIADPVRASVWTTATTEKAIAQYNQCLPAYLNREQPIIDAFRAQASKGLGDALVERAIWYMENGFTVYGHYWDGYRLYGITDCSNYVAMVYKDFGYSIATASRYYTNVGRIVEGVYPKRVNGTDTWQMIGLDKLQPGDIFTYWQLDDAKNCLIGHVTLYMGMINDKPCVIGTTENRPTAVGIVNDLRYWYSSNVFDVRRVLPDNANSILGYSEKPPIIPLSYVLPPQKQLVMP